MSFLTSSQVVRDCLPAHGDRDVGLSPQGSQIVDQGAQKYVAAPFKLGDATLRHRESSRHLGLGHTGLAAEGGQLNHLNYIIFN